MLQVPHHRSGNKENATHLRWRMDLWEADDLTSLLEEGQCLQRNILVGRPGGKPQGETDNARLFGQYMSSGRVHDALRMLQLGSAETASGVLKIDYTVPC